MAKKYIWKIPGCDSASISAKLPLIAFPILYRFVTRQDSSTEEINARLHSPLIYSVNASKSWAPDMCLESDSAGAQ